MALLTEKDRLLNGLTGQTLQVHGDDARVGGRVGLFALFTREVKTERDVVIEDERTLAMDEGDRVRRRSENT